MPWRTVDPVEQASFAQSARLPIVAGGARLGWIYHLGFIFFTAFAFLNMVIGFVVNVMNAENEKLLKAQAEEAQEPTLKDIHQKLERLERLMAERT